MVTELSVKGMTCGHCVMSVKKAAAEIPGVSEVTVDLASGNVRITHDENVSLSALVKAVEDQGYEVVQQ